jgi:hypothetical protein
VISFGHGFCSASSSISSFEVDGEPGGARRGGAGEGDSAGAGVGVWEGVREGGGGAAEVEVKEEEVYELRKAEIRNHWSCFLKKSRMKRYRT